MIERKDGLELRQHAAFRLEELKLAGAGARTFAGYGAVFGNVDAYGDVIAKGAFRETLKEHAAADTAPAMLSQHGDWSGTGPNQMPIGRWTLLREDEKGLYVEGRLSDTERGREAYTLLKDGALSGLSIGYVTRKSTNGTKPGEPRRTLTDVKLVEISLVTFPANDLARVSSVKGLTIGDKTLTLGDCEHALQVAGVPRRLAKKLLRPGWRAVVDEQHVDDEAVKAVIEATKVHTAALSQLIKRI
jgi:uncharacterized protein